MTSGRSPNYPSIPLVEAIERIRPLYHGIHTRTAEREIIAQNLNYKGLNGRSMTMIASLVSYGLLIKEGKGLLRVSDRTVPIMELDKGTPERAEAVRAAAFDPSIFAQINSDFGERAVKDDALKLYLVKKGFLPAAAEDIIRVYRNNIELVNEEAGEYDAPMQPATPTLRSATREEFDQTYAPRQLREGAVPLASATRGNELRFNISRGTQAIVVFTGGDVTQEAIDKLSRMLELQKDTYPTEEDLQTLEDYAQGKIKLEPEA